MKLFVLAGAASLMCAAALPGVSLAREISAGTCLAPWAASYTTDQVQRIDVRNVSIVGRTCPIPQTSMAPTSDIDAAPLVQDQTSPVKRLTRDEIRAELDGIKQAPSDSQNLALGSTPDASSPN